MQHLITILTDLDKQRQCDGDVVNMISDLGGQVMNIALHGGRLKLSYMNGYKGW